MQKYQNIAFLFPGQGAQYVGMGRDLYKQHATVRQVFEEGSDLLQQDIASLTFDSDEATLAKTRNSQIAIYVYSMSLVRLLQELMPQLSSQFCAGLSLGEYSALTAAGKLSFVHTLPLVQKRAEFMSEACLYHPGSMAVIMGMQAKEVQGMVAELNLPRDLWTANFNCPGQVVISGTHKGVEAGCLAAKERGAKKAISIAVEGAFHSGLMQEAQDRLSFYIQSAPVQTSPVQFVMNCTAQITPDGESIKQNLVRQVTQSILWQESIETMQQNEVDLYLEIGCGKTLSGMNKRIGITVPTLNLDSLEDLNRLQQLLY